MVIEYWPTWLHNCHKDTKQDNIHKPSRSAKDIAKNYSELLKFAELRLSLVNASSTKSRDVTERWMLLQTCLHTTYSPHIHTLAFLFQAEDQMGKIRVSGTSKDGPPCPDPVLSYETAETYCLLRGILLRVDQVCLLLTSEARWLAGFHNAVPWCKHF